jgi:hypothetical protein
VGDAALQAKLDASAAEVVRLQKLVESLKAAAPAAAAVTFGCAAMRALQLPRN